MADQREEERYNYVELCKRITRSGCIALTKPGQHVSDGYWKVVSPGPLDDDDITELVNGLAALGFNVHVSWVMEDGVENIVVSWFC